MCLIKNRWKITKLLNIRFNYNRITKICIQTIIYAKNQETTNAYLKMKYFENAFPPNYARKEKSRLFS